jgi:hypothetical protein
LIRTDVGCLLLCAVFVSELSLIINLFAVVEIVNLRTGAVTADVRLDPGLPVDRSNLADRFDGAPE